MSIAMRLIGLATLLGVAGLGVAGCSPALSLDRFAATAPALDPLTFFTGHVNSWGVIENRAGAPSDIVTTNCVGTADGPDGLRMVQHVTNADGTTERIWHMRRLGGQKFEATANDMVGTASGQASGRVFHWTWVLATRPGAHWRDVTFEQWFYAMDGGSMVIRSTVTKLGVVVAEVTEQFHHTE